MTYKQLDLFANDDEEEKIKKEVEGIDLSPLFERLAKSQFRSSFYLNAKDKAYIQDKGWKKNRAGHARNHSPAAGSSLYRQRWQADTHAPWHLSAFHRPARHWLLLSWLLGEMAWHSQGPSADAA